MKMSTVWVLTVLFVGLAVVVGTSAYAQVFVVDGKEYQITKEVTVFKGTLQDLEIKKSAIQKQIDEIRRDADFRISVLEKKLEELNSPYEAVK